MTRPTRIGAELGPLLARLIEARTAHECDRILLEGARDHAESAGAALWRRDERGWREVLGIGDAGSIPAPDRVRAVLEERLGEDVLPPGELVVRARSSAHALALGGVARAHAADELEALLLVARALEATSTDDASPPVLPSDGPSDP